MPEAFQERRHNLRMYVLLRFGFSVLYRIQNQKLQILSSATMHITKSTGWATNE